MNMAWIVALSMVAAGEAGAPAKPKAVPPPPARSEGMDVWRMTLAEAIRIGVENCEVVRVISSSPAPETGARPDAVGMTIAPLHADASTWRFRDELMAHVRSVEQQYWALSQQQIGLWSREQAVKLGEEIVRRERGKLDSGSGTTADVAEAQQNLERFQLAYSTAMSDTITTERQLRNLLGLPPADGRRIVPVTAPLEAKYEPDWEASLAAMLLHQPEIRLQQEQVATAERRRGTAADAAKPDAPAGLPAEVAAACETLRTKGHPDRQRASLQEVIHQSTHTLARFFLEVDANYKQFQTAKRLREAAQARLQSARAFYEEGRTGFTVDRLLDAVSQYSDAIVQEAQYKTSYNTSIAALGEAKGTLLADCKIAVVEPKPGVVGVDLDFNLKPAAFTTPTAPAPVDAPRPAAPKAEPRPSSTTPGARVIRYDIAIEGGPLPIGLKGTISIGSSAQHGP